MDGVSVKAGGGANMDGQFCRTKLENGSSNRVTNRCNFFRVGCLCGVFPHHWSKKDFTRLGIRHTMRGLDR